MSLDIRAGYLLVVGTTTYPILFCGEWSHPHNSTIGMKRMCRVSATVKRKATVSSGARGDDLTTVASVKCTPIDPITGKTTNMIVREIPTAPTDLKECFVDGGDTFYQLVLEKALK